MLQIAFNSAVIKPSVVCSFASSAGSNPRVRMALLVSDRWMPVFICGNFFSSSARSNRAWKCSTVEPLVKVIQSAPLSSSAAPARPGLRFRHGFVDRDVIHNGAKLLQRFGKSGSATSARNRHIFRFSMSGISQTPRRFFFPVNSSGVRSTWRCSSRSFRCRRRADRRDAHAADVAQILKPPEKNVEKCRHPPFTLVNHLTLFAR